MKYLSTLLVFISSFLPVANAQTLVLSGSESSGSLLDRMSVKLAENIKKYSNNNIKVNNIRGHTMGSPSQVIQHHLIGTVDINYTRPEYYGDYVPEFGLLSWGMTFESSDDVNKFFSSTEFIKWKNKLIKNEGIRILAAGPDQPRVLFSSKPVRNVQDIKGLKIRVPKISTYLKFWQALGAQPTEVDWSEVFLSLKSGLVQAAEADFSGAYSQKFHIAAPYITKTNHIFSTVDISINEEKYQSLSDIDQLVVEKAAKDAIVWVENEAKKDRDQIKEAMIKAGATVYDIDRLPLVQLSAAKVSDMEEAGYWPIGTWQRVKSTFQ